MEASTGIPRLPPPPSPPEPNIEKMKQNLLQKGVIPTPKIIHTLRKKHLQKFNRRQSKLAAKQPQPILTDSQKQVLAEEAHFNAIKSEYRKFSKAINGEKNMVGKPWERQEKIMLQEIASEKEENLGFKLKKEYLDELRDYMENEREKLKCILLDDDDVEVEQGLIEHENSNWTPPKHSRSEAELIRNFVERLSVKELSVKEWSFTKIMRHSGLLYTEKQMLKILDKLGDRGHWKQALSVVDWVYNPKEHRQFKSRFVYTKLLAVLGKARRPKEALKVFKYMRGDVHLYPDMASYRCLSVTLGQAGMLKELMNVIQWMKEKPKKIKHIQHPEHQPDVVVFNAVLNACVTSRQWKGVSWVFDQLRKGGLQPNGATYGLAMEVMLASKKYDLVHKLFGKMQRSGEALSALTYKVLVKSFREEGKIDEAVEAVRDMEIKGIKGTASVYYELACCLCFYGRSQEAIMEVDKLKEIHGTRPVEVTFTGMILSALEGAHINDCLFIYAHCKQFCKPDIGIINAMLKVYAKSDMFSEAKELFESIKTYGNYDSNDTSPLVIPDPYTFGLMLQLSAGAQQWEYFEYVYRDMVFSGFRFEQDKYAEFLVEAARSGKLHLLEHAFDSILENGEVPHHSILTELILQATIRLDHETATRILKAMSLAPFQVTEKQWIELFQENEDRINPDSLKQLSVFVNRNKPSTEATSVNFIRAIQSFCSSSSDSSDSRTLPAERVHVVSRHDEHTEVVTNNYVEDSDWEFVSELSGEDEVSNGGDQKSKTNTGFEMKYSNFIEDEYIDADEDDAELEDSDDFIESDDVPSAREILEIWKTERENDSNSLPSPFSNN